MLLEEEFFFKKLSVCGNIGKRCSQGRLFFLGVVVDETMEPPPVANPLRHRLGSMGVHGSWLNDAFAPPLEGVAIAFSTWCWMLGNISWLMKREKGVVGNLLGVVPKAPPPDSSMGHSEPLKASEREDALFGVSPAHCLVVAASSFVCGCAGDVTATLERTFNAS